MKFKIFLCAIFLVTLVGCQNNDTVEETGIVVKGTNKGDYAMVIPYELSEGRYFHGSSTTRYDMIEVEKGLEERSKEYFSVKNYMQIAGKCLTADNLRMLQRRESDEYPYALNPRLGEFEINSAIKVESPYIVYDVVEIPFVQNSDTTKITGVSLAILMNSSVTSEDEKVQIPKERLYNYGSMIGRKLESYVRQFTTLDADCPIYIALYMSSDSGSSVPGTFIGEGYFTGRSGQFTEINEEWALFPTDLAQRLDTTLYTQFVNIKNQIHDFLPENIDMIGLGRFEDKLCKELKIDVNIQAKTYSEISAIAQYIAQLCDVIDTSQMELKIEIKMFDETYFTMVKKVGETEMSIHDMS